MRQTLTALLAALALSACATSGGAPDQPAGPPSLVASAGQPAPPQAKFYADCIAQSAGANTYDREANLIRFHCTGAPAQAFYDGLAAYSAEIGSEHTGDGRTVRATQKLERNLFGVDHCWKSADAYGCTLVFNAGAYLAK